MSSTSSASSNPSTTPTTIVPAHPDYPPVQPGGSLIVAWQVRNKPVLVVGGGNVAAGRILSLLNADANVHVCAPGPASSLHPEVQHRLATSPITYHAQTFDPSLLDRIDPVLVLTAVDDAAASSQIYKLCHSRRIPVNVADVPPECDFYFGSVHRNGPLQVMVSTNGNGPKLANIVRRQIAESLPANIGDAVTKVGQLRRRLRRVAPKQEDSARRMEWMSRVCEEWTLADLCRMSEEVMEGLLKGYVGGMVPSYRELAGLGGEESGSEEMEETTVDQVGPDENGVFVEALDGSFGWF